MLQAIGLFILQVERFRQGKLLAPNQDVTVEFETIVHAIFDQYSGKDQLTDSTRSRLEAMLARILNVARNPEAENFLDNN